MPAARAFRRLISLVCPNSPRPRSVCTFSIAVRFVGRSPHTLAPCAVSYVCCVLLISSRGWRRTDACVAVCVDVWSQCGSLVAVPPSPLSLSLSFSVFAISVSAISASSVLYSLFSLPRCCLPPLTLVPRLLSLSMIAHPARKLFPRRVLIPRRSSSPVSLAACRSVAFVVAAVGLQCPLRRPFHLLVRGRRLFPPPHRPFGPCGAYPLPPSASIPRSVSCGSPVAPFSSQSALTHLCERRAMASCASARRRFRLNPLTQSPRTTISSLLLRWSFPLAASAPLSSYSSPLPPPTLLPIATTATTATACSAVPMTVTITRLCARRGCVGSPAAAFHRRRRRGVCEDGGRGGLCLRALPIADCVSSLPLRCPCAPLVRLSLASRRWAPVLICIRRRWRCASGAVALLRWCSSPRAPHPTPRLRLAIAGLILHRSLRLQSPPVSAATHYSSYAEEATPTATRSTS